MQIYDFFIFTIYGHIDKLFNLRDFPFQNLLESCTDIFESRFRRYLSIPIRDTTAYLMYRNRKKHKDSLIVFLLENLYIFSTGLLKIMLIFVF